MAIFPTKPDTVTAETLVRLLKGETLNNLDAVFSCSTTRLAAHIHRLRSFYNWPVQTITFVRATKDGRIANCAKYQLIQDKVTANREVIEKFIQEVERARQKQKAGGQKK